MDFFRNHFIIRKAMGPLSLFLRWLKKKDRLMHCDKVILEVKEMQDLVIGL